MIRSHLGVSGGIRVTPMIDALFRACRKVSDQPERLVIVLP
jgi:hypothetical protein